MCGIAGFVHLDPAPAEEKTLRPMLARLVRRGPDGEGMHLDGSVALGHRRLSIIDLAGGAQPLSNEDGSIWVTFNGEIFNFMAIREELSAQGHLFKTRSDTEVIVHLYEQYGRDFVRRLDGFFAFALYDAKQRKMILARDRLGVKPLFWFRTKDAFVFASTIPALRAHPGFPHELNAQAVWDFLSLQYVPRGTVYSGVEKLPPGFMAELSDGELTLSRYWKADYSKTLDISYRDACAELRRLVRKAVADRLISDVPLGIFLSGGMDSTIIAGVAAEAVDGPLKCYSIGFREKDYDERAYAEENAARVRTFARHGFEHHIRVVEPCDAGLLEMLVSEFGEPYADASMIPTCLLSRFAREEVTVALSGDGADEVFCGYERYIAMRWLGRFDFLSPGVRRALFGRMEASIPSRGNERGRAARVKRLLKGASLSGAARYLGIVSHTDEALKRRFTGAFFDGAAPTLGGFNPDGLFETCSSSSEFDLHTYLPNDILPKVDTASMAVSLEVRSPFLDYKTVEFAASLPYEFKEKGGHRKRILADTFAKYLPPGLAARKKRGFGVPLAAWFRKEWKDLLYERLLEGEGVRRGMFDPAGMETLLGEHQCGLDHSYALFSALVLEMFLKGEKA